MNSKKTTLKDEINNPSSGYLVPIAILVGGFLIIWGITKMLGGGAGYQKLVEDLHSKTFGNRWVAAYDLSKYIASEEIPKEDIPWLIDELSVVYQDSDDQRTRNFIVLALGALKDPLAFNFLNSSLSSDDKEIRYSSVVGLSRLEKIENVNISKLKEYLDSDDEGLKQVILLMSAKHKLLELKENIKSQLSSDNIITKYNSITSLVSMNEKVSEKYLENLFFKDLSGVDVAQHQSLKLNVLQAVQSQTELIGFLERVISSESNQEVKTKAKQALLRLK